MHDNGRTEWGIFNATGHNMNSNDIRKAVELLDELEANERQRAQFAAARQAFVRLYDEDGVTRAAIELFDANGEAIGGIVDIDGDIVSAVGKTIRDRIGFQAMAVVSELTRMGVTVASREAVA